MGADWARHHSCKRQGHLYLDIELKFMYHPVASPSCKILAHPSPPTPTPATARNASVTRDKQVMKELMDASTLKPEIVEGVDIMVVRELTGDVYFGEPKVGL